MAVTGSNGRARVVIAGGGFAGLEALLALADLAGERAEITLVAPEPDFVYRPLLVEEPFGATAAERHELEPLARELGARFVRQPLAAVRPDDRVVGLGDRSELNFDALLVCAGGRGRSALTGAVTFPGGEEPVVMERLLEEAAASPSRRLAFVVPPGVTWPLPLYELALMAAREARELGLRDLELELLTPESAPLAVFGTQASDLLESTLAARGVTLRTSVEVTERDRRLVVEPDGAVLDAGAVVALPLIDGPEIAGLPADAHGFIPIDEHARVRGLDDVYAAGDATNFPIKQGGIGTQQADAAAEHLAARLGAPVDPRPFEPVLRGKLILGDETLSMRANVGERADEGVASTDYLWWPPHKVSGRYLAPYLAGTTPHVDLEPPEHALDVEVALPTEWHREPMALDPYS
jgi:sulfide:quinone oxidoreductase